MKFLLLPLLLLPMSAIAAERLTVSENGRYLQYESGRPFFYLADTAWELLHRLNREEAEEYLQNRKAKGFTVIQAVVLAQLGGLDVPNPYGDVPLVDSDPARPNEAYFRHVDHIVNTAESLGLYIGMLPTWGSYWKQDNERSPALFNVENARTYGRFLGERYREKAVIWILGGDADIESAEERAVIDAMAMGLDEGDGGAHLMTFHPRGPGMASKQLRDAGWLDFYMSQSSHASRDHDNGLYAEHDYALQPPKPTVDGEPRYELIPVGFYFANFSRLERFDDYDARQAAYWSVLAGACGHTYGHNSVWQMWAPGRKPVIHANVPWRAALDHPGAFQMRHLRWLFETRPFHQLEPDGALVIDGPNRGGAKIRAARARNGSFAVIYSSRGAAFTVDQTRLTAKTVREVWYDPRYGAAFVAHSATTKALQTYTPPTQGRGNDWILILEDAEAGFPLPEESPQMP